MGGRCPSVQSKGALYMYVTAHSGTLKKNLADGVTNRLHAVQQGVNTSAPETPS